MDVEASGSEHYHVESYLSFSWLWEAPKIAACITLAKSFGDYWSYFVYFNVCNYMRKEQGVAWKIVVPPWINKGYLCRQTANIVSIQYVYSIYLVSTCTFIFSVSHTHIHWFFFWELDSSVQAENEVLVSISQCFPIRQQNEGVTFQNQQSDNDTIFYSHWPGVWRWEIRQGLQFFLKFSVFILHTATPVTFCETA